MFCSIGDINQKTRFSSSKQVRGGIPFNWNIFFMPLEWFRYISV